LPTSISLPTNRADQFKANAEQEKLELKAQQESTQSELRATKEQLQRSRVRMSTLRVLFKASNR
jgi:hypothetical protein